MSSIFNQKRTIPRDGFCLCLTYDHRPKECQNHEYPARFCPIGLGVLKLDTNNPDAIRQRVDEGSYCSILVGELLLKG